MSSSPVTFSRTVIIVCLALAIAACGHEQVRRVPTGDIDAPPLPGTKSRPAGTTGEQAAIIAVRQIGVPYLYGGRTTRGFDCSGLVQYAWSKAGKQIPRTTTGQWRRLPPVEGPDLRVGDLLFFRIGGRISHVGLYLGDRRFVHAPSSGRDVTIASLETDFYRESFVRAARP